jgi:hypothetical protein
MQLPTRTYTTNAHTILLLTVGSTMPTRAAVANAGNPVIYSEEDLDLNLIVLVLFLLLGGGYWGYGRWR